MLNKLNNDSMHIPIVVTPNYGESLIGYLLRLDNLNNFKSGSLLNEFVFDFKEVSKYRINFLDYIDENFNVQKASEYIGIPAFMLENLMLKTYRKKLYRYDCASTKKLLGYSDLKICPLCFKEYNIPLLFLLNGVDTCTKHGTKLISKCSCDKKIKILGSSNPQVCPKRNCKAPYTNLILKEDPYVLKKQFIIQSYYNSFLFEQAALSKNKIGFVKDIYKKSARIGIIENKVFRLVQENIPRKYLFTSDILMDKTDITSRMNFAKLVEIMYQNRILPYLFSELNIPNNEEIKVDITEIGIALNKKLAKKYSDMEDNLIINEFEHVFGKPSKEDGILGKEMNMVDIHPKLLGMRGKVEVSFDNFNIVFDFETQHRLTEGWQIDIHISDFEKLVCLI